MSTSLGVRLTGSQDRDIFESLESCEKLMTAREVARILAISEKTVYSYVSRNLIPHYKIEANVRFRARDVADWLKRHGPANQITPTTGLRKAPLHP
ncbi:MAG TPA: helix-turn-helix domain-containing protein [Bryobacteraceae bacterium]|nr:helix-turn-helix domain-containing protein [Bryobacteraceae bacterium]